VDPWALRTKVRYLYDTHRRQLALEQEVHRLRALTGEHTETATHPRPGLPHPDARVPAQRPMGAHAGELEKDRT
jgi:hypothetical protein